MIYTDPSGYKFKLWKALLFAPFGLAAISPGTKYASGEASLGQAVGEYVVNAAAFIAGGSIGVSIPGIDGAILGGMASGAISGGGMVAVNGGNFEDIIGGIAMGANIGALAGAVSYGVITGLGAAANGIGKSLVQGNGNIAANVSRWGNTTTGWLQLSSTSGFSYIAGNGIQSNLIPNIAMSINGALAGSWGMKMIPAGRVSNETIGVRQSIKDWYDVSGTTSVDGYVNPRSINDFHSSLGIDNISVLKIKRVRGQYNTNGTLSQYSLNGIGTGSVNGTGGIPWSDVHGGYNFNISTLQSPNPNSISGPEILSLNRARVYQRYGPGNNPWWRRMFFGIRY